MKKMLLFLLVLLCPLMYANALNVNYDIDHFYVDSYIQENGDLLVNELIVLNGSFNGYERDILYKNSNLLTGEDINFGNNEIYNSDGIKNIVIKGKTVNKVTFDTINDSDFQEFIPDNLAQLGSSNKYTTTSITDGYRYRMYYYTNNSTTAFLIQYTVSNAIVVHNDVAELYWTFIGSEFDDRLNDVQMKVHLPQSDTSSNFRIWAHGDLSGDINKVDDSTVFASVDYIDANSLVDIRMTFDKSMVSSSTKYSYADALENIQKVEDERKAVADEERKEAQRQEKIASVIVYGSIGLIIGLWVYVYIKFDKELKPSFLGKYNREFIDDYNVEVIDYLMKKNITSNAMSASIMNLIYKKNISVEKTLNSKGKEIYTFTKLDKENNNESEKYLMSFLFEKVGKDNKFTTTQLKDYASSTTTYDNFTASYTTWKNKVTKEGIAQNFYQSMTSIKLPLVIITFVIMFINFMVYQNYFETDIVYLAGVLGFCFIIYLFSFSKRTVKGNEHYCKWKGFKNFLNDFGTFETKDLPEIILWDRYLVYATIFGLADKVSKEMNVKIKEFDPSMSNNYSFTDYYFMNSMCREINHSVSDAFTSAAATRARVASSNSSSSGFGGGFSSGGGFGGGGGGGRGF